MQQYLQLLGDVFYLGTKKGDRTGTGTLSKFGTRMEFDLEKGFPLLTTKAIHTPSVIHELLWMLSGDTNVKYLNDNKVKIWDIWADKTGDLGPIYGKQWRAWEGHRGNVDQISELVSTLRKNPNSRRMVVSTWNVDDLPNENESPEVNVENGRMALAPCHCLFQCDVTKGKLNLQIYQRSCDLFLGVPFNIAFYALLTHMLAQQADLEVGKLIWVGGDTHIYSDHVNQVELQLSRELKTLPTLVLRKKKSIFDYKFEDISFIGYNPDRAIKAPISK